MFELGFNLSKTQFELVRYVRNALYIRESTVERFISLWTAVLRNIFRNQSVYRKIIAYISNYNYGHSKVPDVLVREHCS